MKVTFILAEAALEPIPSSLRKDARIINSCKKLGKSPIDVYLINRFIIGLWID